MRRAETIGRANDGFEEAPSATADLHLAGVDLLLPDGRKVATAEDMTFAAGGRTLVTGPSGSGKSTLFRAIAGIWPFGKGRIAAPAGRSVMLLPQRPYIPQGTLRHAVAYPAEPGAFSDAAVRNALTTVKLGHLVDHLDSDDHWQQRLSGGEQQRLAVARAILARPDWLFLDEATASLDEPLEAEIYAAIRDALPQTTIVSIGHRTSLVAMHDSRVAMTPGDDGVFRLKTPEKIGA
jgi:putative ATP-binding cassette transporter